MKRGVVILSILLIGGVWGCGGDSSSAPKNVDVPQSLDSQETKELELPEAEEGEEAFKEVEDALMAIKTYNEELKATKIRNDAAINAEMLSGQRYDKGQTSYLEVLESQRQSFDAQLAYAQTQSALLESYIALYKALGGGWLSPEEEQQAKDEQAAEEQKK